MTDLLAENRGIFQSLKGKPTVCLFENMFGTEYQRRIYYELTNKFIS